MTYLFMQGPLHEDVCKGDSQVFPFVSPTDEFQGKVVYLELPVICDVCHIDPNKCLVVSFGCPHIMDQRDF